MGTCLSQCPEKWLQQMGSTAWTSQSIQYEGRSPLANLKNKVYGSASQLLVFGGVTDIILISVWVLLLERWSKYKTARHIFPKSDSTQTSGNVKSIVIRYLCIQRGTQEPMIIHYWQAPKSWSNTHHVWILIINIQKNASTQLCPKRDSIHRCRVHLQLELGSSRSTTKPSWLDLTCLYLYLKNRIQTPSNKSTWWAQYISIQYFEMFIFSQMETKNVRLWFRIPVSIFILYFTKLYCSYLVR